jgi:hypothetical protein
MKTNELKEYVDNVEEIFKQLYPEYVAYGRSLHPFIDLFEQGWEQCMIHSDEVEDDSEEEIIDEKFEV